MHGKGYVMNKKHMKHLCILAFLLLGYALLSQYIFMVSGLFIHRALIWNVFLALLPLLFMYLFLYASQHKKHMLSIFFLIAWLLLFPNVPYLMTDFIHISPLSFYELTEQGAYYIRAILPWLELMHIALGVWFGMMVGYRSLFCFQDWVHKKYGYIYGWIAVFLVSILSGFGVFLGRFPRLNSWDVLHPASLLLDIKTNLDSFALAFTISCSVFILLTYLLYYGCFRVRNKSDNESDS